MKVVNIYIGTDSTSTRNSKKKFGFVLECILYGTPYTKEEFGEVEGTYNRVVLAAVNKALERVKEPCEIHIFAENTYILAMMKNNVSKWANNGFTTSKGHPVKNQDEWKEYWILSRKHLIVPQEGKHSYQTWIKEEIERRLS